MKVTHEKLSTCLKIISSQCWLISGVEIWGGPKAYILKSGGAMAPPAPLVPPPMMYNIEDGKYRCFSISIALLL